MKKYIISNADSNDENNAGSKAGKDAVAIACKNGYTFVRLYHASGTKTTVKKLIEGLYNTWKLCGKLQPGDLVFLQYPVNRVLMDKMYKLLNRKKVHIVTLIHDIDYLRNVPLGDKGVEGMRNVELSLLAQSEFIIAHNSSMIKALQEGGIKAKFVSLELFDYLYDGKSAQKTNNNSIIVAGNLLEKKAGYLYRLDNQNFKLSLYGLNLGQNFNNSNAEYHGSFSPDELIENMQGDYGLVWDGSDVDTCSGSYGQYLKINNPHKGSLYMAAGLPVIVWKESALYPFVSENGIGFGVNSLCEIDLKLRKQNYEALVQNVQVVQTKVRNGFFLKQALQEVEKVCEKEM